MKKKDKVDYAVVVVDDKVHIEECKVESGIVKLQDSHFPLNMSKVMISNMGEVYMYNVELPVLIEARNLRQFKKNVLLGSIFEEPEEYNSYNVMRLVFLFGSFVTNILLIIYLIFRG